MKNISRNMRCGARLECLIVFLVIVFCLLTATNPLYAQWIQTNGPYGGEITALVVAEDNIYAGTARDGLYRLPETSVSWENSSEGLVNQISAIVGTGQSVIAGTPYGAYRSTDKGSTWVSSSTGMTSWYVTGLAASDSDLLLTTQSSGWPPKIPGVFLSTDSGLSWTPIWVGEIDDMLSCTISGGVFWVGGSWHGLSVSTDRGKSWASRGLDGYSVYSVLIEDGCVFAGTNGGIFRSTDDGASWEQPPSGGYLVRALESLGSVILAGTEMGGVLRSTDRGLTWEAANVGLPNLLVTSLEVHSETVYAGTMGGGVFTSGNGGSTWAPLNRGLTDVPVNSLAGGPAELGECTLWAGSYGRGVFCSTDGGASWLPTPEPTAGLHARMVMAVALGGSIVIAATDGSGVVRSTDAGVTWALSNIGMTTNVLWSMAASETLAFAAGPGVGVFRSTDAGSTWSHSIAGLDEFVTVVGSDVFAMGRPVGLHRSSDLGLSWIPANTGLPDNVFDVAGIPGCIFAATQTGILRSTDSGESWMPANGGLKTFDFVCLDVFEPVPDRLEVFAGGYDGSVWLSTDRGSTWTDVSLGLGLDHVNTLLVSWPYLFAGGAAGIWRRLLTEMTTDAEPAPGGIPAACELSQNYPNPFNPSTTIRYGLPIRSFVSLTVYNTLGQQVATLVEGEQEAGYHEAVFDAKNLASGVYFYRLQAGDFVHCRKLLLAK